MEDGRISDSQITASSVHDNPGHNQTNARLNHHADSSTKGAWCAGVNNLKQWIQVDLGVAKMVSGVVLQGREDYNDQWVTRYKVQHGYDDINALVMFATPKYPEFNDKLVSYDLHIDIRTNSAIPARRAPYMYCTV